MFRGVFAALWKSAAQRQVLPAWPRLGCTFGEFLDETRPERMRGASPYPAPAVVQAACLGCVNDQQVNFGQLELARTAASYFC